MNPEEAKRWLPFRPCDQTSNQRLVYEQMVAPENRELFLNTIQQCKTRGWEYILTRMVSSQSLRSDQANDPDCCGYNRAHYYVSGTLTTLTVAFSFNRLHSMRTTRKK